MGLARKDGEGQLAQVPQPMVDTTFARRRRNTRWRDDNSCAKVAGAMTIALMRDPPRWRGSLVAAQSTTEVATIGQRANGSILCNLLDRGAAQGNTLLTLLTLLRLTHRVVAELADAGLRALR